MTKQEKIRDEAINALFLVIQNDLDPENKFDLGGFAATAYHGHADIQLLEAAIDRIHAAHKAHLRHNLISDRLQYLHVVSNESGEIKGPFFSAYPCGCCGSRLGGDRYEAEAVALCQDPKDGLEILDHYDICPDCVVRWQ
jgi:hypothetical protein